jgi:hypothetical protein
MVINEDRTLEIDATPDELTARLDGWAARRRFSVVSTAPQRRVFRRGNIVDVIMFRTGISHHHWPVEVTVQVTDAGDGVVMVRLAYSCRVAIGPVLGGHAELRETVIEQVDLLVAHLAGVL